MKNILVRLCATKVQTKDMLIHTRERPFFVAKEFLVVRGRARNAAAGFSARPPSSISRHDRTRLETLRRPQVAPSSSTRHPIRMSPSAERPFPLPPPQISTPIHFTSFDSTRLDRPLDQPDSSAATAANRAAVRSLPIQRNPGRLAQNPIRCRVEHAKKRLQISGLPPLRQRRRRQP